MAFRARRLAVVLTAAVALPPGRCPAQGPRQPDFERIDAAVAAAVGFLQGTIDPNGRCRGEVAADDPQHGGLTGLCALALVSAGAHPTAPPLARAMDWLQRAELKSVYAVSMRACALAAVREPNVVPRLAADVRWLLEAAGKDGVYTYTPLAGRPAETFDNCNAQAAMMAVAAAAARGVEVPEAYWRIMERHWLGQQQPDGGWGYRTLPGVRTVKTYGSMTAGALASLYLCFDRVHRGDFVQCAAAPSYKPIEDGLAWLTRHFAVDRNPGIGENWHCFYLHALSRAALAGGQRTFGPRDWYAEGAAELLARQSSQGSWGYGDGIRETCFALMFLSAGRQGIALSKLRYPGRWNARPRDAANFAQWLSGSFERPLGWQVVEANSPLEDLCEAPVLYVSGAGPIELDDRQVDTIRAYVHRGGMVLTEAACNSGDFTLDVQRLCRRLFPQYPLERLEANHPVYSAHFSPEAGGGLMGLSNGVRLLVVHAPRELSLGLQMGPEGLHLPWFELAANIYFQATDKVPQRRRGGSSWPRPGPFEPVATIRLARLKHKGNWDPEPLAWTRLSGLLAQRHRVRLEVGGPLEPAELDPARWPLAAITGTADPGLSAAQLEAVKAYLAGGGTLIVDAAAGSRAFGQWVETVLLPLAPEGTVGPVSPAHVIYRSPESAQKVSYRRTYALALGERASEPQLVGVQSRQRLAIVYSPDDLSCAMVGYGGFNIRGYSPQTAVRLMANVVCWAGGAKLPAAATGPSQHEPERDER